MKTAADLISPNVVPLRTTDSAITALQLFDECKVSYLPVVEEGELVGLVSEEGIYRNGDFEGPLHRLSFMPPDILVQDHAGILDILRVFDKHRIPLIPVVDASSRYLGAITALELTEQFATYASAGTSGGILVVEVPDQQPNLSEILRIAESQRIGVKSLSVQDAAAIGASEVHILLDRMELQNLIAALEYAGFRVVSSFTEARYNEGLRERYDHLMAYLGI